MNSMQIWLQRLEMMGAGAPIGALVVHLAACPEQNSEEAEELRDYIASRGAHGQH